MTDQYIPKLFILFGPPGAGKGEQSKRLSKAYNLPHISTGNLLRSECQKDTIQAKEINALISKGQFPSDELVLDLLVERINAADCKRGFILDGYPRNLKQAKTLDLRMSKHFQLIFINITIDEETLITRLTHRQVCPNCSATYHKLFLPPKIADICEQCETPLIQRSDDKKEVILERIGLFEQKFGPMFDYYKGRPHWFELPSKGSPTECFNTLIELLEPLLQECAHV